MLAEYLFATYPVNRVEAFTDVENIAERRAAVAETAAHLQWLRDLRRVAVLVDPSGGGPDRYSSVHMSAGRVGP